MKGIQGNHTCSPRYMMHDSHHNLYAGRHDANYGRLFIPGGGQDFSNGMLMIQGWWFISSLKLATIVLFLCFLLISVDSTL